MKRTFMTVRLPPVRVRSLFFTLLLLVLVACAPATGAGAGGVLGAGAGAGAGVGVGANAEIGAGAGAGAGGGGTSIRITPVECNEDGTYYPGDSFIVNYSVVLPPAGEYTDRYGNPCKYYYTFGHAAVWGDHVKGGTSTEAEGSIPCVIDLSAPAGPATVFAEAHCTYNYQYWVNETYPVYENGTIVEYRWHWVSYWGASPVIYKASALVNVVEYDPHFSLFLYPIPDGKEGTMDMDLSLLVRYDGNGPDRNLKERAVADSCKAQTVGYALLVLRSAEDARSAAAEGFRVRPANASDFIVKDPELMAFAGFMNDTLLSQFLNATYLHVGERDCYEYGPIFTNTTPFIFTSGSRYAKYVLEPGSARTGAYAKMYALNVTVSLAWSRFPAYSQNASLELPNTVYRLPLRVITSTEEVRAEVRTIANDSFILLSEPPDHPQFREWWLADNINGLSTGTDWIQAGTVVAEGAGQREVLLSVPRTALCQYNLTVYLKDRCGWVPLDLSAEFLTGPNPAASLPWALGSGAGMGGAGAGAGAGIGTGGGAGAGTGVAEEGNWTWPPTVYINDKSGYASASMLDYLSYVHVTISTRGTALREATFYTDGGKVWRSFTWSPAYTLGGRAYELWVEKPKDLNESAVLFVKLTDVWGNDQVLELGPVKPYSEGIYNVPYSGILTVMGIVLAVMVVYEVMRNVIQRI